MCHSHRTESAVRRARKRSIVTVQGGRAVDEKPVRADWVIVDFDANGFACERCGATERVPQNVVTRVESFALRGEAFLLEHAGCVVK